MFPDENDRPDPVEGEERPEAASSEPRPTPSAEETGPRIEGTVRYRLDWVEYWRAREICWRAVTGTLFLRLVPSAGVVGILTGLILAGLGVGAELSPFFIVFGLGFLSTGFFRRRTARREFRRVRERAAGQEEVRIEWGRDGLTVDSGGEAPRAVRWEEVRVALLTAAGILVEPRRGGAVWLPFSGFEHPEEVDRFEERVAAQQVAILDRRAVG